MFHPAKKLVIITENFVCDKVCKIIESCHAKGYTLLPAGGKGLHHKHPTVERATVVEGFDNVKIEVVIADRAAAAEMADRILEECFSQFPGVIYLEDVEICRVERF
jgi:nitrogen regulatory protein PII